MVSPTQLSVLRMKPVAARIALGGRGRLAVLRLLNSYRGWDARTTPVQDVRWALDEVGARWPGLSVGLVGHSLGGRAALLAGGAAPVRSIVALNPWISPSDIGSPPRLAGRRVRVVHGDHDRIASPARARALADVLAGQRGADVDVVTVAGGKHAMLRHGRRFESLASQFTRETLLGDSS